MDLFKNITSKFTKQEAPPGQGADWEWEDHVLGTLYGNCAGDAIGLLTEFMVKPEAKESYGKYKNLEYDQKVSDGHRDHWEVGDWTDDTDQMLLILLSLLDKQGKVEPPDFAKRMLAWKKEGFPELGDKCGNGIGATTFAVLSHPEYTIKPHQASEDVWEANRRNVAPNGAVMRTSVLGLFQYDDMVKVVQNTLAMCRATHHDFRCRASCVAVTSAISMMLQKRPQHLMENGEYDIKAIIHDSFQLALRCLPDKDGLPDNEAIALLRQHMFAPSLSDLQLGEPGKIGYTYKCMGAGFWALRQTDFRKALTAIVLEAGDADTNGAVAGALLGCKLGLRNIPESWVSGLKHKEWANEKFQRFISLINSDKATREKAAESNTEQTTSESAASEGTVSAPQQPSPGPAAAEADNTTSSKPGHTTTSSKPEEPAAPLAESKSIEDSQEKDIKLDKTMFLKD